MLILCIPLLFLGSNETSRRSSHKKMEKSCCKIKRINNKNAAKRAIQKPNGQEEIFVMAEGVVVPFKKLKLSND